MSTKHSVTGLTEDAKEMNELLVHGYIRMDTYSESIPLMLKNLCLKFFQLEYEILKFSARYKNNQGLKLTDNNQCVKRIWTGYKSSKWIICDTKPIYKGIHCWRIHTENHFQAFIFWGIGPGQKEYDDNNISQYNRVWGIGYDDKNAIDDMIQYEQGRYRNIKNKSNSKSRNRRYNSSSTYNHSHGKSYFWPLNNRNKNNIDLKVFNGKELDIDMYLDANKGELKFKIVGNKLTVAEIWKLPIDKDCDGWVPHFNLCEEAQGSELRVAKIPIKWYGKRQKHVDIFSTE